MHPLQGVWRDEVLPHRLHFLTCCALSQRWVQAHIEAAGVHLLPSAHSVSAGCRRTAKRLVCTFYPAYIVSLVTLISREWSTALRFIAIFTQHSFLLHEQRFTHAPP
jgi:hypothetical protein